METIVLTVIVSCLLVGALCYFIFDQRQKTQSLLLNNQREAYLQLSHQLNKKEQDLEKVTLQKFEVEKRLVGLATELRSAEHQLATLKEDESRNLSKFESMAGKILEVQASHLYNRQSKGLKEILGPLENRIKEFESKVETASKESIKQHTSLKEQILYLSKQNKQVSEEANNLAKALKGDFKKQGNWGEVILEMILEKSGLEKNREYFIQESFKLENGRSLRPDVVIHLPKNKRLIIDSKVSLVAYDAMCAADAKEELLRQQKRHTLALRRHVDELSTKNYHDLYKIESPDFVLLFVPIDSACSAALQSDPRLYEYAFQQNIIIVTPSTLLATLKTVETLWRTDKQNRYALQIAEEAGKMYDKLAAFVQDMHRLGTQLTTVQKSYQQSMNKLSEGNGNVLRKAELVKSLGAKANKHLAIQNSN